MWLETATFGFKLHQLLEYKYKLKYNLQYYDFLVKTTSSSTNLFENSDYSMHNNKIGNIIVYTSLKKTIFLPIFNDRTIKLGDIMKKKTF